MAEDITLHATTSNPATLCNLKEHGKKVKIERKAIPVSGLGGPLGYETSRLPHFLDSPLTDGGEVVRKNPGSHFC
jgi:hypothetical protein